MALRIVSLAIQSELDVVAARQRARQIASLCGFAPQEQTKIATVVSELARNVYSYASCGKVEFLIEENAAPQILQIRVDDDGPGIEHLDLVLSGQYQSDTGIGLGILGARRMMDQFAIESSPGRGTHIVLKKVLPPYAPAVTSKRIGEFSTELAVLPADATLSEVQQQNRELLNTLAELKARQEELIQLTRELEDTNRGVVALYAELDEKAQYLRQADEMKTRFLSNMSHEFRTPLSSIRALAKLLLERVDGELSDEQEKQVRFIVKSAESLGDLVNDLLDLAKIESGKLDVNLSEFSVAEIFSALRGMMRPLLASDSVALVFEKPRGIDRICSDEAKLSQILRNFISNALKFTEAGEVVVSATATGDGNVRFAVRDTGLGIAREHQELIFEEFSQVENRLQSTFKGTGLGLPLCRKLAVLLKGRVELESVIGKGSVFSVVIPEKYTDDQAAPAPYDLQIHEPAHPVLLAAFANHATNQSRNLQ